MLSEAKHLSRKPLRRPFDAADFRTMLLRWYRKNGRDLPWRHISDPYAIFVSEVMLQQTQVATVIPYYTRWLRRFPTIDALARASELQVLRSWQGLGYYSRARNLHSAAKILKRQYRGVFPERTEELAKLPGAGLYTANAIATFAYDRSVPIVEANIGRVLSRVFNLQTPIDNSAGREAVWQMAEMLLPKRGARSHNSALMDLGATICSARVPKCFVCPVRTFCRAKDPSLLPIKKPRPRQKRLTEFHSFVCSRGRVLLEQSRVRWRGLWILPPLAVKPAGKSALHFSEFPFTHHRVTLVVFATSSPTRVSKSRRWFRVRDLHSVPIPSPHRRALDQLLSK
jgi:A/G-specific adenine glycosylase